MTLDLIQVLLDNGAYDEAEELALRYPSVLRTAFGLSPKGLRPQQMYAHLHLAGVHDARGHADKMGLELRTLLDLANKNEDAIKEWRHAFVGILKDVHKLVLPGPGKSWNDDLLVLVARLAKKYDVLLQATGRDGTTWKQIFI
jgi:hypothetical protein